MLEIFVNGNADVARDVFNAISTFVGTESYLTAIQIASVFSVLGGALMYVQSRSLMSLVKWAGIFFAVTVILTGPTSSIAITDTTDDLASYQVDNVPSSLAIMASTLTTLTYGLQKGIEDVFHMPNDQAYTKTGMLFGSQVFAQSAGYSIQDPNTREDFNQFFDRCVFGDVTISHKYTFKALKSAPDIWDFLDSQKMSPIRGVDKAGHFYTCKAFYPIVKKEMQSDPTDTNVKLFGLHLFGSSAANVTALKIKESIQNAYQYFGGVSKQAGAILVQNATINALHDAQMNTLANGNAQAGLENLAYTKTNLQKTLAGLTGAKTAAYWMPTLQVYLLLLIIGTFPLIVLLALIPSVFIRVITGYISSMLLICAFPLVWDILHFLMMSALYNATHDSVGNAIALTYSNANALIAAHVSFASLGGYLMLLSIPLTAALVSGLNKSMIYMGQYLGGGLSSMATSTADGIASGNVSLENFSMGQSHFNNTQANKVDTNSSIQSGMHTIMGANGSSISTTPDGKLIVNNTQGLSQTGFRVNLHERQEAALSHEMSHLQQEQSSLSTQRAQNWSTMASTMSHFGQTEGKNVHLGEGFQVNSNTSVRDSASYASGLYNNWQLSHDHSDRNDHSASRGMSAEAFARLAFGKSGSGSKLSPLSFGFGASANLSASRTNSHSDQQAFYNSLSADQRRNYDQAMDNLQNYGHTHNLDLSNTKNQSLLNQMAAEARHDHSLSEQEAQTLSKMDSVSSRQSYVQSNSQSIDQDATQGFVNWMQTNHPDKAGLILSRAADSVPNLIATKEAYVDQFLREQTSGMLEKIDTNAQANTLTKHYTNQSSDTLSQGKNEIEGTAKSNISEMNQEARAMHMGVDPAKAGQLAGHVIDEQFKTDVALADASQASQAQRHDVHDRAGKFEKQHQEKMDTWQASDMWQESKREFGFDPENKYEDSLDLPKENKSK